MEIPARTAAIALAMVSLAACTERASPEDEPLHSFEATLVSEAWSINMTFDGPVAIMDRDGTLVQAYRLEIGAPVSQTVYVDSDFRVVREDSYCSLEGRCELYRSVDWRSRGGLPPFGIGLLHFEEDGRLQTWDNLRPTDFPIILKKTSGSTVLTFPDGGVPPHAPQFYGHPMTYVSGRLVPETPLWNLTSYVHYAPLPHIPAVDFRAPTPAIASPPGDWPFYPDSGKDHLEHGFPDDAFWAAVRDDERTRRFVTDGCLFRALIDVDPLIEARIPGVLEKRSFRSRLQFTSETTELWGVSVEVTLDELGRQTSSVTDVKKNAESSSISCDSLRAGAYPQRGLEYTLDAASRFRFGATMTQYEIIYVHPTGQDPPPEAGWSQMVLLYQPDYVKDLEGVYTYQPYEVAVDLSHGWFNHVVSGPDDFP